jgi:hypothetical protein
VSFEDILELIRDTRALQGIGETAPLADWDDLIRSPLEALRVANLAREAEQAARAVRRNAEAICAELLGDRAVRSGDNIVRMSKPSTWRCHDLGGFAQWLAGQDAETVGQVVNPNSIRIGQVPARETWFDREFGEPGLTHTPVDKAPKKYQGLDEGELSA